MELETITEVPVQEQPSRERVKITISSVIEDLHNGITRCKGDINYSEERGSIQEKYELSKKEVEIIFNHPTLKGRKVIVPKEVKFELVDDVTVIEETTETEKTTEEEK